MVNMIIKDINQLKSKIVRNQYNITIGRSIHDEGLCTDEIMKCIDQCAEEEIDNTEKLRKELEEYKMLAFSLLKNIIIVPHFKGMSMEEINETTVKSLEGTLDTFRKNKDIEHIKDNYNNGLDTIKKRELKQKEKEIAEELRKKEEVIQKEESERAELLEKEALIKEELNK